MRYVSWNVNGLRAVLGKGFRDYAAGCGADALCLQEVRATPEQVDFELPGYSAVWHPAQRPGYSGTAVFTRREPLSVSRGLGGREFKGEGRVLALEFDDHWLVNVYVPNVRRDLSRLEHRRRWDAALKRRLRRLAKTKPVVCCGDFNVAHREIDLARPGPNRGNAGFTDEERAGFDSLLSGGFVDSFRMLHDEGGHYSWWSYRAGARERNVGWRIDYFVVSRELAPRIRAAGILPEVLGSDHCPVTLELAR